MGWRGGRSRDRPGQRCPRGQPPTGLTGPTVATPQPCAGPAPDPGCLTPAASMSRPTPGSRPRPRPHPPRRRHRGRQRRLLPVEQHGASGQGGRAAEVPCAGNVYYCWIGGVRWGEVVVGCVSGGGQGWACPWRSRRYMCGMCACAWMHACVDDAMCMCGWLAGWLRPCPRDGRVGCGGRAGAEGGAHPKLSSQTAGRRRPATTLPSTLAWKAASLARQLA